MSEKRHKLLERQLKDVLPLLESLPQGDQEALNQLFEKVSQTYDAYEEDRDLIEHSMELSSEELFNANREMREQNKKLKETQEKAEVLALEFKAIFDNAAVGILAVDENRKCVLANKAIQQMLGYTLEELQRMNIDSLTYPDDLNMSLDTYNCSKQGDSYSLNKRYVRKDGSVIWARLTAAKFLEHRKELAAVGIIEDITAQRAAEETIKQQQVQIQNAALESAHAAGMSEIATGILHNVGNVLNSVNVGLETIFQRYERSNATNLFKANDLLMKNRDRLVEFLTRDPQGQKLINFYFELGEAIKAEVAEQKTETEGVMKKVQLIKEIVNTQQTYAKGRAEFKEKVSLIDIVENTLVLKTASLARHEVKLVKEFKAEPFILCQRAKLIHVILNLLKNAIEAMEKNGIREKLLVLEVGEDVERQPYLKITDTGSGIGEENLNKIFTHGFTTKTTGHGFGLHFCATALIEMGGKIVAKSEGRDKGTEFTLTFGKEEIENINQKAA